MVLQVLFGHDTPTGTGPVVSQPSATASRTPAVTPSATATPTPTARPTPAVARAPLTVLNHSRRTRLAARAADQFRDKGWTVVFVGNTRYDVTVTTVYYEPGQEAAAATIRREFPAVQRALPRPAGLDGDGLTVVVTREYPA